MINMPSQQDFFFYEDDMFLTRSESNRRSSLIEIPSFVAVRNAFVHWRWQLMFHRSYLLPVQGKGVVGGGGGDDGGGGGGGWGGGSFSGAEQSTALRAQRRTDWARASGAAQTWTSVIHLSPHLLLFDYSFFYYYYYLIRWKCCWEASSFSPARYWNRWVHPNTFDFFSCSPCRHAFSCSPNLARTMRICQTKANKRWCTFQLFNRFWMQDAPVWPDNEPGLVDLWLIGHCVWRMWRRAMSFIPVKLLFAKKAA